MRTNGHGIPVVAIDIDGTLAEYHLWFLKFAEQYTGRKMPDPLDASHGTPLWEFAGFATKAEYQECKLAYRQGGLKRSMPCLPGAAGLINSIRAGCDIMTPYGYGLGAEVWICTTRPYLRLDNVDPDTREWLRRSNIRYDALLFDPADGDEKYAELKRQAGDRVACALEDLPEQAYKAALQGVPHIGLRSQPYNYAWGEGKSWQLTPTLSRATRWETPGEAWEIVRKAAWDWRIKHEA